MPVMAIGTLDQIAKTGVINLGYRQAASPFSFPDSNRKPIGYSIDLCSKVVEAIKKEVKRAELKINYIEVTPATRMAALASNEIDLECVSTTNTAERRLYASFTIPTYIAGIRILSKKDRGIKEVKNLVRKKIVITLGTSAERVVASVNESRMLNAQIISSRDYQEAFKMLENGEVDAFATDDILLAVMQATSEHPEQYIMSDEQLTIEPLALMMRKDDAPFKQIVDQEIKRVIVSGEINEIYKRWFESPIPPRGINLNLPMDERLKEVFKSPTDQVPG